MTKGKKFCCPELESAALDPDIPVTYIPKFREFGISILDGGTSSLALVYCPWCGEKLPGSLRDLWFDELQRLGIDPARQLVPDEFTDDRWYEMRAIA